MSSNVTRDFNQEAVGWDENPSRLRLASEVAGAILERVCLHPSMNVLDFGCGTGLLSLPWASRIGRLSGADSARVMLDVFVGKAAALGLADVVEAIAVDDAVPPGPYDLIVSSMTLHHIREVETLLASFFVALSPGGQLCLADLDPEGGLFHEDNRGVFHFGFDRAVLCRLLSATGFVQISECTATEVVKPAPDGERRFSVFLITAEKPGR